MVEFPSGDDLRRYFEGEGQEVSCLLASRCALRVLAGLSLEPSSNFIPQRLQALRAILVAAGNGANPDKRAEWKSAAVGARDALVHPGFENPVVDAVFAAVSGAIHTAEDDKRSFESAAGSAVYYSCKPGQVSDYAGFFGTDVNETPMSADAIEAFATDRRLKSFANPVWPGSSPPPPIARSHKRFLSALGDPDGPWIWWREWYLGMWNGQPMDWDFALEVAQIDDDIWGQGASAVADEIERLRQGQLPEPPPDLLQRFASNKSMLILLEAAERENVADAREKLRGENGIDEETRKRLNDCLDRIELALSEMVDIAGDLSVRDDYLDTRLAKWWRTFFQRSQTLAKEFASAENIAEATVPTALILGCTAIGTLFGQPITGAIVGGLVSNQLKPGQAAKELGKPSE